MSLLSYSDKRNAHSLLLLTRLIGAMSGNQNSIEISETHSRFKRITLLMSFKIGFKRQ